MNAPWRLIIFDCDGTLVDSRASITRVANLAFARLGLFADFSTDQIGAVVGLSLEEAMRILFPALEEEKVRQAVLEYKKIYQQLADAGALRDQLFPDVREILERLRQMEITVAMATGKSMRGVERTLREHDLQPYFHLLKSSDCAPSKPHPGMIQQILAETAIAPEQTVMIGDTDFDLEMGRRAGVRTCAVTFGCHPRQRLAAAHPDFWLERMGDLFRVLALEERS